MDHLHDSNLLALDETKLPGFVKVANEKPLFFAYSDGIESYFPIDTASNAWLSAHYFEKNASTNLSEEDFIAVHNRIFEALQVHGITYDATKPIEKVAEDPYTFEKWASEVKVFEQNYKHVTPEERHTKAKEILHRYQALKDSGAEVHGSLPKIVDDYAGDNLREDWPEVVKNRASKVNDTDGKEAYHELSKTNEDKMIILKLLSMLDAKFGLDHYYDRGILDPYRALLTTREPEKKKVVIMVVNGKEYDHEKIASLNPLDLSDTFGGDILTSLIHNASVYLKDAPEFVKVAVAQAIDSKE